MSTMVESVTLSMFENLLSKQGVGGNYVEDDPEHMGSVCLDGHFDLTELARAAIEALIPFLREVPNTSLVETGQRDPHWIWDDAADSQREAIIGYVQAALKEKA